MHRTLKFVSALVIAGLAGVSMPLPCRAQYMYLDTNGNGVHDAGDTMGETGSTVVDIWLRTDKNRDDSDAACSDPNGTPNDLLSYTVVLRAVGGTVAWSGFTNRMTDFAVSLGQYSDSIYYANGRGGAVLQAAGTYRLATITVTPQKGTPYLVIDAVALPAPIRKTTFGSTCTGLDGDNTLKLSRDWFDSDGAGGDHWLPSGVPLVTGLSDQFEPAIASDGSGGAIVVWTDMRAGAGDRNIYAQRIDASGNPFWASGGIAICTDPATQESPRIVSDGAGGAIIAWQDTRVGGAFSVDLYAQRISASGTVLWTSNGVPICTAAYNQELAIQSRHPMIADGSGGAIIVWTDHRAGGPFHGDIYSQKINGSGVVQWTMNGVAICTAAVFQYMAVAVSDGSGGAVFAWEDYRNDPAQCICTGSKDIYAQRVNGSGSTAWTLDGVAVCVAAGDQSVIAPVPDGAGGAIFSWEDARVSVGERDVYAQRINSSGVPQWTTDGIAVTTASGAQTSPSITTDASGGAIIAWKTATNLRVQRIDGAGGAKWGTAGVSLGDGASPKDPVIASDGPGGGAIIVWQDQSPSDIIRGQRLEHSNGASLWSASGVAIAPALLPRSQLVSDGVGGLILAWETSGGADKDIFAMRVAPGGGTYITAVDAPPNTRSRITLGPLSPNPFNPSVTINFSLESRGRARVMIYDALGRKVRTLADRYFEVGARALRWDGTNDQGNQVASGIYYCRLEALGSRLTRTAALVR